LSDLSGSRGARRRERIDELSAGGARGRGGDRPGLRTARRRLANRLCQLRQLTFELVGPLGGLVRLLPEHRHLPGLGEVEQHQNRETADRCNSRVSTDRVDELMYREG
jgi:hypothetical protein